MGTSGQSITLANSIIGVGILAMPFCFQQCGVVLATLILLFMGMISRLSCYFLLKSALLARRRNYEFLAFHVFGPAGKTAVEIGIIGFLMGTCVAYFVVVGDLGPQIISKMFHIDQSDTLRTTVMVVVSLACVLPLGLLRNVDSLSGVSAATIGFYFCLVIKVISEAATQMWKVDWFSKLELWRPAGVLQCAPIFAMALFCQTQLFEIFESLPTLSLEKMNVVTKNAINICAAVYFTLGLFGYIAFSSQTISGNILVSLSPTLASDVIKLGFVLSLAFSFPLVIFPCRASLYSFLYKKVHTHDHIVHHSIPDTSFRRLTVLIVVSSLCASLASSNVERVLGLLGASAGGLVCLVLPAAAYCRLQPRATTAKIILVLGLIIMVLGTYANLEAEDAPVKDERAFTQDKIDKIVEDFFEGRKDKVDESIAKPLSDGYQPAQEIPKAIIKEPEIIKDSEAQPPNPVPPESQPEEKIPKPIIREAIKEMKKEIIKMEDEKLNKIKNEMSKIETNKIDTHPKNVKGKLENLSLTRIEEEKIKQVEDDKKSEDKIKSDEKTDELHNQEKLIETIKQHGQEQKELIKEQKEILDEMLKTKEEIKQNKKEAVDIEAKKLAVESIQKIANIAIQSLAGGSEKPNVDDKKEKPFEKIANEAVQEIAIKAVESIVAINKIEEKLDENVEAIKETEIHTKAIEKDNLVPTNANENVAQNEKLQNTQDTIPNNEVKEHSHAADEPQSYKQGEDKQNSDKFNRNVPIAVALNGNSNGKEHKENKQVNIGKEAMNDDHPRQKRGTDCINTTEDNEICDKDLHKKMVQKDEENDKIPKDIENENFVPKIVEFDQILPNVDLNNLLRNSMDAVINSRSLKSVKDEK